MSRTWVRQVTLMNESCYTHESDSHTYKRFMSHWLMIAFITWNGKTIFSFAEYSLFYRALWQKRPIILRSLLICYPCLRVYVPQIHVDHTRVRHVTLINESCHTHEWDMSHLWMSHDTHMNETRHTYEWVMSHAYMSHVAQMKESHRNCNNVFSFHVHHHITCRYMHTLCTGTWICQITHTHESCTHMNESYHAHECVMSCTWMSRVAQMNESCCTHERVILHI